MTVTILVPVYGVEKYIAECAESLFSQTYQDIEYVFCDDCTLDKSIEILKSVLDKFPQRKSKVRIVRQECNKGLGAARVRLVHEVKSPYFCIVDSDDVLPLNSIEILVRTMEKCDKDVVEGAYADYIDGKKTLSHFAFHGSDKKFLRLILCQNMLPNRVWGRLYKSTVLDKLPDMFFEKIDYSEDFCAVARLAAITTRTWTDEIVYLYRKDNAISYTNTVSMKNNVSFLEANNKVLQFYRHRGHLPMCLEIGMLNAYRQSAIRTTMKLDEIDALLHYVPEHFRARLLYALLRNRKTYSLGDLLYRFFRKFCC